MTGRIGRELDVYLAKWIMGWHTGRVDDDWLDKENQPTGYTLGTCYSQLPVWNPSTDKLAALELAKKLRQDGWRVIIISHPLLSWHTGEPIDGTKYTVKAEGTTQKLAKMRLRSCGSAFRCLEAVADTFPLALTRAAEKVAELMEKEAEHANLS